MTLDCELFGAHLRAERVRRGISLDSIADQTKIQKSFLEGLERGDLSKWPAGIVFRRAYVRDYATAVGLSPDVVGADFARLALGKDESLDVPARQRVPETSSSLVLTFDTASAWQHRLTGWDARAAAIDAAGILVIGIALALVTGGSVWTTSGMLAFVYYPATTVAWGRSLASRYLASRRSRPARPVLDGVANTTAEARLSALQRPSPDPLTEESVLGRLEAAVEPMLLSMSDTPHSHSASQETTAH